MKRWDVVVIGAGAAGLMCGLVAGGRHRRTLILEHTRRIAHKIRISGGGRCNFTNIYAAPENFQSENSHFCISALRRYTPHDFLEMVERHDIAWHEKKLGQLFCDGSAQQIIDMLCDECAAANVSIRTEVSVETVEKTKSGFRLWTTDGQIETDKVVIATGGKSIPKMGATGFGYQIARQFGISVVPPRPALVPFTLTPDWKERLAGLSGVSVDGRVQCRGTSFEEAVLITHRGLSGPAILQISSYWQQGDVVTIDLAPGWNAREAFDAERAHAGRHQLVTPLSKALPRRLAQRLLAWHDVDDEPIASLSNAALERVADGVHRWQIQPGGTEGYRTAEVTLGGVDTRELSSKTMESRQNPGLFFIGEVVDVTGHLGGFNFQWAWASGFAAGQSV